MHVECQDQTQQTLRLSKRKGFCAHILPLPCWSCCCGCGCAQLTIYKYTRGNISFSFRFFQNKEKEKNSSCQWPLAVRGTCCCCWHGMYPPRAIYNNCQIKTWSHSSAPGCRWAPTPGPLAQHQRSSFILRIHTHTFFLVGEESKSQRGVFFLSFFLSRFFLVYRKLKTKYNSHQLSCSFFPQFYRINVVYGILLSEFRSHFCPRPGGLCKSAIFLNLIFSYADGEKSERSHGLRFAPSFTVVQ